MATADDRQSPSSTAAVLSVLEENYNAPREKLRLAQQTEEELLNELRGTAQVPGLLPNAQAVHVRTARREHIERCVQRLEITCDEVKMKDVCKTNHWGFLVAVDNRGVVTTSCDIRQLQTAMVQQDMEYAEGSVIYKEGKKQHSVTISFLPEFRADCYIALVHFSTSGSKLNEDQVKALQYFVALPELAKKILKLKQEHQDRVEQLIKDTFDFGTTLAGKFAVPYAEIIKTGGNLIVSLIEIIVKRFNFDMALFALPEGPGEVKPGEDFQHHVLPTPRSHDGHFGRISVARVVCTQLPPKQQLPQCSVAATAATTNTHRV